MYGRILFAHRSAAVDLHALASRLANTGTIVPILSLPVASLKPPVQQSAAASSASVFHSIGSDTLITGAIASAYDTVHNFPLGHVGGEAL